MTWTNYIIFIPKLSSPTNSCFFFIWYYEYAHKKSLNQKYESKQKKIMLKRNGSHMLKFTEYLLLIDKDNWYRKSFHVICNYELWFHGNKTIKKKTIPLSQRHTCNNKYEWWISFISVISQ